MTDDILKGVAHDIPVDFKKALTSSQKVLDMWKSLTPLARNEWICWVISGKKEETRNIRIAKTFSKLKSGMRRPCCWGGCIHRIKNR